MRIRQIKAEYWRDKALMLYTRAEVREFYIGLWMTADDAGWFDWDVTAIGAELYPFVPVNKREKNVARYADILELLEPNTPHLIRHACGHAQVPKMPQHQRVSRDKRVTTVEFRHQNKCRSAFPAGPRGEPRGAASPPTGRVGNGKEMVGNGKNAQAREDDDVTSFDGKVPTFSEIVGGRAS